MHPGDSFRRWRPPAICALAAICALTLPPAAIAASSPAGILSPRLAELAQPSVRTAPPAQQARDLSLAREGPGSLLRQGNRILVDVRFDAGAAAAVDDLRAAGAEIVNVSSRYQTVTVAAKPAELRALSAVPGVAGAREVLTPIVATAGCTGLTTSEGDSQLGAASAREAFNLDGSGVTVGILSDSFDTDGSAPTHAAEDVASGDLPGPGNPCGHTRPVGVLEDFAAPGEAFDEGRAMAQIVHDLAPGAALDFATAFEGELGFAENIRALASAGASVIADDVFYPEEPFFQDGPVAVAADEASAHGAAYFSAAGNDNLLDAKGNDIASWEAPEYRDAGGCPTPLVELSEEIETKKGPAFGLNPEHCMDFDPGSGAGEKDETFGITVEKGATLVADLQWAEPRFGVNTDLNAYLFDSGGNLIGESGERNTGAGGTQQPVELLGWENDSGEEVEVQLVINRFSGAASPRLKFALLENGGGVSETEYPKSTGGDSVGPTIFGHSGAAGAVSVGAVRFSTTSAPEPYSSRGPLTHYFGPVLGTSAAKPISPESLAKPDLVATDCVQTTFFVPTSTPSLYRFCGTSAAAPHAAAVAALMRQANPSLPVSQLRTALASTASPVGGFGPDAVGAGLIDAFGAVGSVALPPRVSITEAPPALGRNRSPKIAFAANRPASFECSLDGSPLSPCTSPFVPARLSDGVHAFVVRATDVAGRSGSAETARFTVDATPPRTFFRKHPRKVIRTHRRKATAVFRFRSNEQGATFICRVDGGLPRFCKARFARRFRIGTHVVSVRARDLAGNVDPTPASFRFKVRHRGG
jgi:hypothetical protein